MIRAVCFDMDGVLFDTEGLGLQTQNEAAACQGLQMTEQQTKALIGVNMKDTRKQLREWFGDRMDGEQYVKDWCRLMHDRIHRDGLPLKPYADETLRLLKQKGYRLALCSSNTSEIVADYLALAGWQDVFDAVISGSMITHGKPEPDIYLLGASRLGVTPGECAGVEDAYHGIRAVHAAGMRCVMVPDQIPYRPEFDQWVDVCLKDLSGLLEAIQ